jgi:hypothetical protein
LALSVGAINALLSRWLLRLFSTIGLILALLLFFPEYFFAFMSITSSEEDLSRVISVYLLVGLGIFFVAPLFLLLFMGLAKSSAGREFLFGSEFCDVAVNSAPDFIGDIEVQTFPTVAASKRRHFLYDQPSCGWTTGQWIVQGRSQSDFAYLATLLAWSDPR